MRLTTQWMLCCLLLAGIAVFTGCTPPDSAKTAPTPPPDQAAPAEPPRAAAEPPPASQPESTAAATAPGAQQQKWVIGMSQCNLGEPWRVQMNKDVEEAAAEHPEVTLVSKDAQNDTLVQVAHVEELVGRGVDAIIISPKEAAPLTDPIAKAYQAGIPVIVLDRAVLGDQFTTFIGADNVRIGEAAGKWVASKLNGKGKIVELMGLMTSIPGHDRHDGFMKGIAGSEIEIIFQADMQWLQPNAQREMESALARFDQIDLVYAHNDPGAYGAYLAAEAVGRAGQMMFVGIDGLPHEGLMYVREGILSVTFEYPTGGREAIDTALTLLNGGQVDKHIVLKSRYFTKENVERGGDWLE